MEIELENIDNEIKILEYVIRDIENYEDGETYKGTYFQARIETPEFSDEDSVACSFAFYDINNTFLGVSHDSIWAGDFLTHSPYPVSFEISPPKGTELIKCQMVSKLHKKSIMDYGWQTFIFLIYALLISAIINIWI